MKRRPWIRYGIVIGIALLLVYAFALDEDRTLLNFFRHLVRALLRAL
jgi:hypothetical protein